MTENRELLMKLLEVFKGEFADWKKGITNKTSKQGWPAISGEFEEIMQDLGDWLPEIKSGKGIGAWTIDDLKSFFGGELYKFQTLLVLADSLKLSIADNKHLAALKKKFIEYSEVWLETFGKKEEEEI